MKKAIEEFLINMNKAEKSTIPKPWWYETVVDDLHESVEVLNVIHRLANTNTVEETNRELANYYKHFNPTI